MGNRIHTIDFFSICEFVGELILSFDSMPVWLMGV
jgi:hypothetical protein